MKKETNNLVDFQQRDTEYSYIALSNSEQFLKESAFNFVKETAKQLKMEPYALCGFLIGRYLGNQILGTTKSGEPKGFEPGKEE